VGGYFKSFAQDRLVIRRRPCRLVTSPTAHPNAHVYESDEIGNNGSLPLQHFHLETFFPTSTAGESPECVVHTNGSGARRFDKCAKPILDLCLADVLKKGKKCSITARFSTVGVESGSYDFSEGSS